ncbi:MAG: hypothetical protein C5B52_15405 [Bacteroidetes bacterium]|nr:MAG: hypothetical protein C5B52_15405 [Bacteroidota bacterium]
MNFRKKIFLISFAGVIVLGSLPRTEFGRSAIFHDPYPIAKDCSTIVLNSTKEEIKKEPSLILLEGSREDDAESNSKSDPAEALSIFKVLLDF